MYSRQSKDKLIVPAFELLIIIMLMLVLVLFKFRCFVKSVHPAGLYWCSKNPLSVKIIPNSHVSKRNERCIFLFMLGNTRCFKTAFYHTCSADQCLWRSKSWAIIQWASVPPPPHPSAPLLSSRLPPHPVHLASVSLFFKILFKSKSVQ